MAIGCGIVLDVGDEHVARAVDRGELTEIRAAEAGLRPVESRATRLLAEPLEHRQHRADVAVAQRPHEQLRPAFRREDTGVHHDAPDGSSSSPVSSRSSSQATISGSLSNSSIPVFSSSVTPLLTRYVFGWMFWLTRKTFSGS